MSSTPEDDPSANESREAFLAGMKTRLEQAQASGQSSEQIRALASSYARDEIQRQAPQVVARARSWWSGFRNVLIVGALASGVAIGLALLVEHRYAAPLCEQYAAQHGGLRYEGIDYPRVGRSSSTTSPPRCMFVDPTGHRDTVSLDELQPNAIAALLTSFALQIEFIVPVAFILIAMMAVAVRRSTTRLN
ncbi:MAG: hypothetical protein NTU56_12180 [Proteobacteria bacterium]|nr:hypothetical protein [Pseudomonadota bacterium]